MPITAQLFDGTTLEFPDGTDPSVISKVAKQETLKRQPQTPQEDPSLLSRAKAGAERQLTSAITGVKGAIGSPEEAAAAAKESLAKQQQISKDLGPVRGWEDVKKAYQQAGVLPAAGEFISQIPGAVAEQVPNIAGTIAAGLGGAKLGGLAGPIGATVGGIGGALAYQFPQMFGANLEQQAQVAQEQGVPLELDRGKAAAAGLVGAGLEVGGTALTLGGGIVRSIIGKEVTKSVAEKKLLEAAQRSLLGGAAKGAVRGTSELPVEVSQQVLTRWQAGQDLLSDEAISDYGDAAYGALQVGPATGAIASPMNRRAARKELEERGLAPTGEPIVAPVPQDRKQLLQQEQQSADYMRSIEQEELDKTKKELAQLQETAAQDMLTQVNQIATLSKDVSFEPDTLTDSLDSLYAAKDNLAVMKGSLERVPANTDVRKAINAELKALNQKIDEGQKLAKEIGIEPTRRAKLSAEEIKAIPPELRAKAAAEAFTSTDQQQGVLREVGEPQIPQIETPTIDTKLSKQELLDAGLPSSAAYIKQLSGLDLSVPEQRTQAANIIGQAVANPRVKPEVKTQLQSLYDSKLAAPVPETQGALDFDTAPAEVVPAAPQAPTVIDDSVFDNLGIGKTAVLRRNEDLRAADLTKPEDRQYVRDVLEMYRDAPNRSDRIKEKIDAFLEQIPVVEAPVVEAPVVETPPQAIEGVQDVTPTAPSVVSEPTLERPAGEPSMGVGDVGSDTTAAVPSAPGGVQAPEAGGLDVTGGRVGGDLEGAAQAPVAITPESISTEAQNLAQQDEPSLKDIARVARQAYENNLLPELKYKEIVREISARDPMAASTLYDAIIDAQNGLDIANAAQAMRANGDSAGALTPQLEAALAANNPQAALEAILNDDTGAFNAREQLVARRILDMRMPLPTMRTVDSLGTDAKGNPILGQFDSINDEISLVRGAGDSHTFLHELIHAFVHRTIIAQETGRARNPNFKNLQDVYSHVLEARPDLAEEYGLSSLTEFASEAMSNREFQMQLMGIEYRNQSVFSWFARVLRELFGIGESSPQANVLFTAMVSVDGLMRGGRDFQIASKGKRFGEYNIANSVQNVSTPLGQILPTTLAEVNAAPTQVLRTEGRKFMNTVSQSEAGIATALRQQTVDILAPVARKLNGLFTQGVNNQFGDVNPMVALRQALDHQRIALQVFRAGGLRQLADGTWEAYDLKDAQGKPVSPQKAIEMLAELAKKQNTTYSVTKARVSTVLEGMRLKDLREHNRKIEALALEQAKAGDIDAAYETRLEKFPLHMTNAEIDALVDVYSKTPEIQDIQRVMNATRSNLIDAMVKSGRLRPEQAESWKAAANYVPFDRLKDILENPEIVFAPGRKGIAAISKLPQLKGSFERPVANVIDSYMNKLAWMTEQTMRNAAVVRTLNTMADAGMARKIQSKSQADNTHLVLPAMYENGQPVFFEVQNHYDLAAFSQAPEASGAIVKLFAGSSRLLRTTVTATPMFALKQVIDDAQRVMFYSGVKHPLAAMGRTLLNLPRIVFMKNYGNNPQMLAALERSGIVGEYDFNPVNPAETIEFDAKAVKRSPVRALIHAMEQITKASDMAARLAVYEQTMKESGDSALAHARARELINFNRQGASKTMRTLTHVVPFFNSWAQGLDLLYRGFTGEDASSGLNQKAARNMFITRILTMMGMGTLYAAVMGDDEGYKETTDMVRDRAWILPTSFSEAFGMKQPFKIPVPTELGFIFKSIPERAFQYYREHTAGEAKEVSSVVLDLLRDVASTYGNEPIPAILRPALENLTNFSFFTKRELVSKGMSERPPALQYTSSTSEFGKWLGEQSNTSPIKIDNMIRGYFGLMGSSASMVLDGMMNPARPDRGLEQMPFLSIGLLAPVGSRTKDDYYEFRAEVAQAVSGFNALKEDPDRQARFLLKNEHLIAVAPIINDKVQALRRVREMKSLYESPNVAMTGAQRREAIEELRQFENALLSDIREIRAQAIKMKK